ncbi:SDR family NAD(P)-dependent oxidoreductase [Agromyces sp. MMS24-JH15]|uniref:SDR family NAD(P)-dependent oxidoreductase n=1 Tax=Agromyces sp. MMS24-JH15 TaxID=3243765 RepID=UPI00374A6C93
MHIANKVFVVTGAGNGIGRETTLRLLAGGASVAGVDLNADGLAETARLAGAGGRFSQHVVNITDREAVAGLPAAIEAAHGQVDGIVNIAGVIQQFMKVVDLPFSEIDKVMNVNFGGVMNMCKAFLPTLLARPEAAILNVASMGSYAPVPGQAVYGASKAAVKLPHRGALRRAPRHERAGERRVPRRDRHRYRGELGSQPGGRRFNRGARVQDDQSGPRGEGHRRCDREGAIPRHDRVRRCGDGPAVPPQSAVRDHPHREADGRTPRGVTPGFPGDAGQSAVECALARVRHVALTRRAQDSPILFYVRSGTSIGAPAPLPTLAFGS